MIAYSTNRITGRTKANYTNYTELNDDLFTNFTEKE